MSLHSYSTEKWEHLVSGSKVNLSVVLITNKFKSNKVHIFQVVLGATMQERAPGPRNLEDVINQIILFLFSISINFVVVEFSYLDIIRYFRGILYQAKYQYFAILKGFEDE